MQVPDLVNGLFELVGGVLIWKNVQTIRRDKMVRGVTSWVTWFFTTWGFWNLFYYPHLAQWLSFTGGLAIVSGNFAWCYYAWRYRKS
jgi:hypothetical protein